MILCPLTFRRGGGPDVIVGPTSLVSLDGRSEGMRTVRRATKLFPASVKIFGL